MIVTELLTRAAIGMQTAASRVTAGRLRSDGLDIPKVDPEVPEEVKQGVGRLIAIFQWVGGGFIVAGLIMIGIQMAQNRRHQRQGGGEDAEALGWWALGALVVGLALVIAGWVM